MRIKHHAADNFESGRRRQASDDSEEGGEGTAEGTNGEQQTLPLWSLRGVGLLTSGLAAGIPPVEVHTGPPRNNAVPGASTASAPAPKKRPLAVAVKPPAANPAPAEPGAKSNPAATASRPKPVNAASGAKPSPGKPLGSDKAAAATTGSKAKPVAKPPQQIAPKTEPQ